MQEKDKERLLVEVEHRVLEKYGESPRTVEDILFDTIYEEKNRLKKWNGGKKSKEEAAYYKKMYSTAARVGPARQAELLQGTIRRFAEEVVGHFDPRVYALATMVVPPALNVLLNSLSPLRLLEGFPENLFKLQEQMVVTGETEMLQELSQRGTIVLVSTHQSNLDSIMLGFALFSLGLPPFTYGAGLNLFSNKMIGFFMHNLGAYKVDRRKTATLYKDVLKAYAGCTMELGYHNMFFPGGTRSRSGSVEDKLKMGLLGMGLDAYIHNLIAKKEKPDVFVVPCTINYELVLEAETLIDDYLKDVGKSRYIIEDDEFSKPRIVLDFVRKLFSLDSKIHLVFGRPMDVFGNFVDRQGRSHDRRGRVVDRKRYVYIDGEPGFDEQRNQEYTRELAGSIVEAFHRGTVVKSTYLLSRALFEWLLETNPGMGLYRLLRTGGGEESVDVPTAYTRMERELAALKELEKKNLVVLDEPVRKDIGYIAGEALAHFKAFHRHPAVIRRGDRLFPNDRNLLLFYQNRLNGFDLDKSRP